MTAHPNAPTPITLQGVSHVHGSDAPSQHPDGDVPHRHSGSAGNVCSCGVAVQHEHDREQEA